MIDGEGCVSEPKRYQPDSTSRHVTISNTEASLVDACCEALDVLGIAYTVHEKKSARPQWSDSYVINIGRRAAFDVLLADVQIQHPVKQERLQRIVDLPRRSPYSSPETFPVDLVRHWYCERGMTQKQIGAWLGINYRTVGRWIKDLNIGARRVA